MSLGAVFLMQYCFSRGSQELEFFFPTTICHGPLNTALYSQCTCCVIKPHAVSQGKSERGPSRGFLSPFSRRETLLLASFFALILK